MTVTDLKLYEKYNNKEMSSEDIVDFENRIKTDEEFALQYENYLDVLDSLELSNNDRLAHKITKILDSKGRKSSRLRIWTVAASLLLVSIVSYVLISDPDVNQDLYDDYFSTYQETNTHLSSERSDFDNCINSYNRKDYKQAIICLKELKSESNTNFYLGMSYLNQGDLLSAESHLIKVESLEGQKLEEANWYLALIFLESEDKSETIRRLQLILDNPNGNYKKQSAKKLLEKLNL